MTQIERLKKIYNLLVSNAFSKQEIIEKLELKISVKQIERDLIDLKNSYLRENEDIFVQIKSRKHFYRISKKEKKKRVLSIQNLAVVDLLLVSNNLKLFKNFKKEINLFQNFTKALRESYGHENRAIPNEIIYATDFYQLKENKDFEHSILKIYEAIAGEFKIHVQHILHDVTAENPNRKKSYVELIPLQIIYHRGDFYLAVIEKNKFSIYEIAQFKEVNVLNKKFSISKYKHQLNHLKERFGITRNINDKIYPIKLQFSESTGSFVSKMHWHETQRVQKTKNNYILTMNCGISRELVGWIFQWMHNVKILEPPELIEFYNKVHKEIEKLKSGKALLSLNPFEDK